MQDVPCSWSSGSLHVTFRNVTGTTANAIISLEPHLDLLWKVITTLVAFYQGKISLLVLMVAKSRAHMNVQLLEHGETKLGANTTILKTLFRRGFLKKCIGTVLRES